MQADSKYVFGCSWGTHNNFCINSMEIYKATRCFESMLTTITSDAHYCYNCNGCQEIMFCINQKSKRHSIGNRELPRDQYATVKKKLLDEIAEMLRKDKTAPSHIDVFLGRI
jgi:hemoglobin-like flavoprotein